MSKETFSRLMNQLGSEAEQEKLAELRVAHRRKILLGIARAFSWVILAGVLAYGCVYREEIGRATHELFGGSEPAVDPQAKVQRVLRQVEKHMATAEETGQ